MKTEVVAVEEEEEAAVDGDPGEVQEDAGEEEAVVEVWVVEVVVVAAVRKSQGLGKNGNVVCAEWRDIRGLNARVTVAVAAVVARVAEVAEEEEVAQN